MRRVSIAVFAVSTALSGGPLAGCTDDSVDCLTDEACQDGSYCKDTRCIEPSSEGELLDVYTTRVVPLIETGCNCHGPASTRPWRFDHRTPDSTATSLADLRNWLYNPEFEWRTRLGDADPPDPPDATRDDGVDAEVIIDRFALIGYATAQCGFNHPQIWPPGAPQLTELALWFERAYAEVERPPPLTAPPATTSSEPLPPIEEALYSAAVAVSRETIQDDPDRDGYDPRAGYGAHGGELAARLAGQCGCCHLPERRFRLPLLRAADERAEHADRTFCQVAPTMPAYLEGFALGTPGDPTRARRHPVVYTGADDPRFGVLQRWFAYVAAERPAHGPWDDAGAGEPTDPCHDMAPDQEPGDMTPDGDVMLVDPVTRAVDRYMGPIGQIINQRCGGAGCHGPDSPSLPHSYPFADFESARAGLGRLDELGHFNRANPRQSGLIRVGVGEDNHVFVLQPPFNAGEIDSLTRWIGDMPPSF